MGKKDIAARNEALKAFAKERGLPCPDELLAEDSKSSYGMLRSRILNQRAGILTEQRRKREAEEAEAKKNKTES